MKMRVIAVVLLVGLIVVAGCAPKTQTPPPQPGMPQANMPPGTAPAADLGKTIYETGVGEAGKMVAFDKGSDKFRAKPSGCILCHGADGLGVTTPKGKSPAVTYASLREAKDGKPAVFPTDEALKKAIIEGLEPNGESFNDAMPRWKLSDPEYTALVDYLKSLDKAAPAPAAEAKPEAAKPEGEKPAAEKPAGS